MIGRMSLLVKSGPSDLNLQDEPKVERESEEDHGHQEPVRRGRLNHRQTTLWV